MGRQIRSWGDKRGDCYYVRLGDPDPKTGKLRPLMLRDEQGGKIRLGDESGKIKALARLLEARDEAERRRAGPTVSEVMDGFLAWHETHGSRPATISTHEWHLGKFAKFEWGGDSYQHRLAASIDVADLTRYRKSMEARGCDTGYIKLAYASVLACWRWAARPVEDRDPVRLLDANPFDGLRRPKRGKGRKLILPWPVIQQLIAFAVARNPRVYSRDRVLDGLKVLALRIVAESGCRPHEAIALRWEWTFEAERVLVIPAEATKTRKEDRIVGLPPELAARLAEIRASGQVHPVWVFATANDPREGPPLVRQFGAWFRRLRKEVAAFDPPMPIPEAATLYTLRHSFVSQARAGGMDVRLLAPGMGHSADVAERVYAHSQVEDIRDLMDRARRAREKGGGG